MKAFANILNEGVNLNVPDDRFDVQCSEIVVKTRIKRYGYRTEEVVARFCVVKEGLYCTGQYVNVVETEKKD